MRPVSTSIYTAALARESPERTAEVRVAHAESSGKGNIGPAGEERGRLRDVAVNAPWWYAAFPAHPRVWASGFIVACGWDRAVWVHVVSRTMPTIDRLEAMSPATLWRGLASFSAPAMVDALGSTMYHAIKFFGTVWLAAIIAAVLVLRPFFQPDTARVRRGVRRGTLVFLCPAVAGLLAEALKLAFRRERPEFGDGFFTFRAANFWNASGLGLPSSHAAPAVALAIALGAVFPRWRVAFVMLAALCCLSRVLAGAHHVSDVYAGVFVGLICSRAIMALDVQNNRGVAVAGSSPHPGTTGISPA